MTENGTDISPEALGIETTEEGVKIPEKTVSVPPKKSKVKKMSETFFGGTAKDAAMYVVSDVLVPALKQTLYDMISTGFQRLLFGDTVANGRPVVARPSYSRMNYNSRYRTTTQRPIMPARTGHDFNRVMFDTRADAESVLSYMYDSINETGIVSLADFYIKANEYNSSKVPTTPQDYNFGWTDVRRSRILTTETGYYIIDLPNPKVIR